MKPVLIYDGRCTFCRRWAERFQQLTGDRVDYRPAPDPHPATLRLIETDGTVRTGAAAVYRALAYGRRTAGWWCYTHLPGFAKVSEFGYRLIACCRGGR